MRRLLFISILLFIITDLHAGGILGIVSDTKGERLPFASVIVKGRNAGTMTNADGEYRMSLKPGSYEINFQFLGYKTLIRRVEITEAFVELNVKLEEQTIVLKEAQVNSSGEDAAYTIMRKAIAKSKIHQKQVLSYQASAYIKNSVTLNKIPLILKKDLSKQNIQEGVPVLSESVMEISFTQPNNRFTKVLGQKSTFDGISISDGFYLFDFYDPGTNRVSPLSPSAFRYYRFEYEGFFEDRGLIINKIRVIPKSYGEGVWLGTIYIIDNYWSIHSINVETVENGLNLKLSQYYGPVEKVWMPMNQRIDFWGKLLGFDFLIKAQLNASYSAVKINPALVEEIKLVDEAIEGRFQEAITKKNLKKSKTEDLLQEQKEFSVSNLRKIMKNYEKEERAKARANKEEAGVVSNEITTIDGNARQRDSTYWNNIRSIPLTAEEKKSYHLGDSIKVVQVLKKDSLKQDSIRKAWRYFMIHHDFKLKNGKYLHFEPPYTPFVGLNYNSVEGIVSDLGLGYKNYTMFGPRNRFRYNISGNLRYAFQEKALRGRVGVELEKGASKLSVGVGKYIAQFDPNSYITEWMNTVTTLFNEQNFIKIYDKKYASLGYTYQLDARLMLSTSIEIADRSPLENLDKIYRIKDYQKNAFSTNHPPNLELGDAAFKPHRAFIWLGQVKWTPSTRVMIRNGVRKYLTGDAPAFTLTYKKGMADADFDYLSLGVKQSINMRQAGKLDYLVEVGDFLNNRSVYLMDMKHLNNNYLNALQIGLFARFRLLDTRMPVTGEENASYANAYKFSTKGGYLQGHVIHEFKKLMITQIPLARIYGLKEDFFVNYLHSPTLKNYIEVGYGIDGILKALRLELVSSFEAGRYQRTGVKVGITM